MRTENGASTRVKLVHDIEAGEAIAEWAGEHETPITIGADDLRAIVRAGVSEQLGRIDKGVRACCIAIVSLALAFVFCAVVCMWSN